MFGKDYWINFALQIAMPMLSGLISGAAPTPEVAAAATKALQGLEELATALAAAKTAGKM